MKQSMFTPRLLVTAFAISFLTACGGGDSGGSSTPTVTPSPAPVAAAVAPVVSTQTFALGKGFVNLLNKSSSRPFTITVNSTKTGSTYIVNGTGTEIISGLVSSKFEGAFAFSKTFTTMASLTGNGKTIPLSWTTNRYFDSNYNYVGSDTDSSTYDVVTGGAGTPSIVKVNDTGVIAKTNHYASSAKTEILSTTTLSFVVESGTSSFAYYSEISNEKNGNGELIGSTVKKFSITPSGDIVQISEVTTSFTDKSVITVKF